MESVRAEINLGATACTRLKNIYCPDICWSKCYKDIAVVFTKLKNVVRIYYPDDDKIATIQRIIKMTDEEIKDLL
jgi:hypothetical protein